MLSNTHYFTKSHNLYYAFSSQLDCKLLNSWTRVQSSFVGFPQCPALSCMCKRQLVWRPNVTRSSNFSKNSNFVLECIDPSLFKAFMQINKASLQFHLIIQIDTLGEIESSIKMETS